MPTRRGLLRSVTAAASLGLAGCLQGVAPTARTDAAADPSGDSLGRCPRSPDANGLPDRPTSLDRDRATSFVRAYERALAPARGYLAGPPADVSHTATRIVDGGYRVHFHVVGPTPGGSSHRVYDVAYFVDDREVWRFAVASSGEEGLTGLLPRAEGTLVACREGAAGE